MITATRLRGGSAGSARGAASLAAEAVSVARGAGCTGQIVVRMDSAYYAGKVIAAIGRGGAFFSVTVRMDDKIRAAIAAIPEDAWTSITYPNAIWDEDQRRWISDAQVAETRYAAFTSKKGRAVTARLIVRRVRDRHWEVRGSEAVVDGAHDLGGETIQAVPAHARQKALGTHQPSLVARSVDQPVIP